MRISDWSSDVCSSDLRGVEALKIEQRHRRIDHEAENARAKHVPERYCDETHQWPFDGAHPRRAVSQTPMFPSLVAQHDQLHDLEVAECRANRHDRRGRAGTGRAQGREKGCRYGWI